MDAPLTIIGSIVGALLGLAALRVKVIVPLRNTYKVAKGRVSGALDNLGGREPFVDHATGLLVPGIPPLGERLTGIESTLIGLANVNGRLDGIDTRLDGIDSVVGALVGDKYERGAEAALRAVAQVRAESIDGEVEE